LNKDKNAFVDINDVVNKVERAGEFVEGDTIVVDVLMGSKGERTRL
jgi:hypothetical protein